MKNKCILPIFLTVLLTSCSNNAKPIESKIFCFDTYIEAKLYQGNNDNLKDIEDIINTYDKLTDNYKARGVNNVFTINQTNEEVEVDRELFGLLTNAVSMSEFEGSNFNPLCGSLAKKWKESLNKNEVLSQTVIEEEVNKIVNTHLMFGSDNKVQRIGDGEIDLGGIAKGYTLDKVLDYLNDKEITQFLINGGSSSILFGEKNTKDGYFNVGLKDVNNAYLKLKNCFVSTSSISEQSAVIDGVTYSHIINPHTGSAISVNDAVIVVSNTGMLGDVLSTSMMMNSLDEIKTLENQFNVKTIVVKDGSIVYQNEALEVSYH